MSHPRRPDPAQGVFETMLVLDGRPIELDAHLARLEASLSTLFPGQTPPPVDVPGVTGPYASSTPGTSAGGLRVTVAPGPGGKLGLRVEWRLVPHRRRPALRSLTVPGGLGAHKWADRSLLDKAQAGLPANSLPLIVDTDGAMLEVSRANLFIVRDDALFTPPLDGRILPGITRMRVLELADEIAIDVYESELIRDDLLNADEVFLTGSVRGIERVRSLDGTELALGGEVSASLASELRRTWLGAKVG